MVRKEGDCKSKSSMRRRPLRDVSNGGFKSTTKKKIKLKIQDEVEQQPQHFADNQDPLDRLLLVHSDISSLLRQIDELVVQAVNVNASDNDRITEIKTFTTVLSQIHSSLKPWVPRLQKVLTISPTEGKQYCETCDGASPVADQGDGHSVDTPEPTKHESLVSPSPLVSWRATDCAEEKGKQLFFLTPLLRAKTTTSKAKAPAMLTVSEGITWNATAKFPSPGANDKLNCEKLTLGSANLESDIGFVPHQSIPVSDISTTLITPCLKNPPLRTYVLREPDLEVSYRKITTSHVSTPFPTRNNKLCESTDSEDSSDEGPVKLGLKYPELIGIKPSCTSKNVCRALEASPAWILSPPKCCKIIEPLDEKHPKDDAIVQDLASTFNQKLCIAPPTECNTKKNNHDQGEKKFCLQGNIKSNFTMVESTPLWKGCESTIHRGKRPGENTLKRELWTRFEAASTDECPVNLTVFEESSKKGFLERLEEASSEADPDAFR